MGISTKTKSGVSLIAVFAVMVLNQNCGNYKEFSGNGSFSSELEDNANNTDVLLNGDSIEMNVIEGQAFNISADTSLIGDEELASSGFYRWYKIEDEVRRVVAVNTTEHSKNSAGVADAGLYEAQYIPQNGQLVLLGKVKLNVVPDLKIRLVDFTDRAADGTSDVDFAVMASGPKNISYEWSFVGADGIERVLNSQNLSTYSILKNEINASVEGDYYVTVSSVDVLSQSKKVGPVRLQLGGALLCTDNQIFENDRCVEKQITFSELRIGQVHVAGSVRPSLNWSKQTPVSERDLALIQDGETVGGISKAMRYVENNLGYFTWKMNRAVKPTKITLHPPTGTGHSTRYVWNRLVVYGSNNGTSWTKLNVSITGTKTSAIVANLTGVNSSYRYVQVVTNFTSGFTHNYITEIQLDHVD